MRHDRLSRDRCWPTISVSRGLRTLAARPARTVLAASLLINMALPLAGLAPGAAEAASGPMAPSSAAAALDDGDPAPAPADGLIHLRLIPGENEVRFVMRLRTLLQPPRSAACATRAVAGEIVLSQDADIVNDMSKVVVDMKTLKCAPPLRDNMAQQLLETQKYPTAEFVFEQAPGMTVPLPVGDTSLQFIGQQTVHGVTRPAQYTTAATFGPNDVTGHATTEHYMSAFGLKPPSIPPLIQVEDGMTVQFDFHATITGA